jgi:nucleosome binding factor SPN SPT16 subunit
MQYFVLESQLKLYLATSFFTFRRLQVLLHFRLKHDIMVASKKTRDVQFFLEYMGDDDVLVGPGQKRRAAGDGDEIEEEQRQSALREKIERAFLEFAKKIDAVLPSGSDGKKLFEFQVAFEEMQFVGSPKNQAVDIVPTADCLVSILKHCGQLFRFVDVETGSFAHARRAVSVGTQGH